MDTGFLAAVLIAAVLLYDRLGGNQELGRRLFQIGLAVSLIFAVVSGAAAFIRADVVQGGFSTAGGNSNATDVANRIVAVTALQFGFGVGFLMVGLGLLRRYHTIPLGFVVSGVFLLLTGPAWGSSTLLSTFSRLGAGDGSSQNFDVGAFVTALVGTIVLLAYGMQLEREFAVESEVEDEEPEPESSDESP
jgi:hypothetical protein